MSEKNENVDPDAHATPTRSRRQLRFLGVAALAVAATVFGLALLVNIFQRKQEARNPFFRVVELTDDTVDPAIWGKNFPLQYDDYLKTIDQPFYFSY
jgi:nitrite reductase (cytochrome c-552)